MKKFMTGVLFGAFIGSAIVWYLFDYSNNKRAYEFSSIEDEEEFKKYLKLNEILFSIEVDEFNRRWIKPKVIHESEFQKLDKLHNKVIYKKNQ